MEGEQNTANQQTGSNKNQEEIKIFFHTNDSKDISCSESMGDSNSCVRGKFLALQTYT